MKQKESILIVDDDGSIGRSLALIFAKKGYEAETAVTAQEGLEKAMERSFHIALIDIQLPDMSGTELLKKLKDINPKMPCMIITGHASVENAVKALELGASAYITKPLDMDDVLNRIKEVLEKQKLEQELVESETKFRSIFDNATDGILLADLEKHKFYSANNAICQMLGYKQEEILNLGTIDIHPREDLPYVIEQFEKQTRKEITLAKDIPVKRKDGSFFYADINSKPITFAGKTYLLGIFRDTTERKQAEYKIKHLNLILRAIRGINQLIVREKNKNPLLQEACDILTGVRDYNTAWIGLLKDEKSFTTVVGSPLNTDVSHFCEQVLRGDHPPCIKKAFTMKDQFLFMDRSRDCGDCSSKGIHSDKNTLLIRIAHESKLFGFLVLSFESDIYMDQEEKELLEEVCGDIAFGLYNIELGEYLEKRTDDLKERVKELNCLWEISNLVEKPDISLEEIIERTVNLLPSIWQYPKITCAQIILEGKEYKTENFKETIWKLSTDIMVDEKLTGSIAVCYLEERPEIDEGPFLKEEMNLIKVIAERLGDVIERKQGKIELQQSYQRIKKALDATIETMSNIVEAKDPYTAGHQQRVSQLAAAIAKELNFSEDKIKGIRIASLIHDIGKIGLPTEILSKPSKLSDIELSLIKNHSQIGYDILKSIDFSYPVANIVLQHHERINGSGYPGGLKGDEILLEAKIICVADVVEAMSSHRPYRPALGIDTALEEISQKKGILYDPEVVDVCLKLFKEKEFKFE